MYDPRRTKSAGTSSLDDEWQSVIDAYDLTDAASMFDQPLSIYHDDDERVHQQYMYYDDMGDGSLESSTDSHFYMDLTRFGTYLDEDHPTIMTTSEDPSYQTPPPPPRSHRDYQEEFFRILATPTPPTPIPEFRVFDLTCFIEGSIPARSPPVLMDPISPNRDISRETPILYKVAPPSQDYHDIVVGSMESCHEYHSAPTGTPLEHPTRQVFSKQEDDDVEEEEEEEEQPEEHSTIHLTDFSRSSGPAQSNDLYQCSSYSVATRSAHVTAHAADENPLAIDCNLPGILDRMCRRKPLADTSKAEATMGSVTSPPPHQQHHLDQIHSCGTLPPEVPPEEKHKRTAPTKRRHRPTVVHPTNSSHNKNPQQLDSGKKSCTSRTTRSFVDMSSTNTDDDDECPRIYDSNESQTEAGCDADAKAEADADADIYTDDKAPSFCSTGTVTTEESDDHDVIDRRNWMGNYVSGLFDWNQAKDIFYSSSMEEQKRHRVPSTKAEKDMMTRKGGMQVDFSAISDFCRRVLQHLDMAEVVANIDQGAYDDHLDDFQEDIELCFEDAIEKYEKSLDDKNRQQQKQKQKHNKDNVSVHTQQRHKNLRLLASEELMKQLETDFKMHLLDHFCHEVSKKQRKISTMH